MVRTEKQINLDDSVYGEVLIESPVLIDLEKSATLQRLKGISQLGVPYKYFYRESYSRHEHSLGVMLLLKHLGASEDEQVAGLLHDVSHLSFSHVYDWVVGRNEHEDSQDNSHKEFLLNSEIPTILINHGYSVDRITNYHNFGLLEREIPNLCADRIDYSLRLMSPETAKFILSGLTVFDNQIVAKNSEVAAIFAREFLSLQVNHWGAYENVARYYHFSNALKLALQRKIITTSDFLKDDEYVTNKLENSGNKKILDILKFLEHRPLPVADGSIIVTKNKFRFIDPPFIDNKKLTRLSSVDKEFSTFLKKAKENHEHGILV